MYNETYFNSETELVSLRYLIFISSFDSWHDYKSSFLLGFYVYGKSGIIVIMKE